jgi:hypothetical protein
MPKPIGSKAQETCTFIVLPKGHLSKQPTRFIHGRSVSPSTKCLHHLQEPLEVQHLHNSEDVINQATCLVDTRFNCRYFSIALNEYVPLESQQQHTCAKQDKESTVLPTLANSTLSVVFVVSFSIPFFLAKQPMRITSQSAASVSGQD